MRLRDDEICFNAVANQLGIFHCTFSDRCNNRKKINNCIYAKGVCEGVKYCRNCGNKLPAAAKFCDKCGNKTDY